VTEELDDDRDATLTLADIVDEGGARRLDAALEDLGDPALKELIVSRKQGSSNPREGARRAREGDGTRPMSECRPQFRSRSNGGPI
jgi:hypothetical protein